MRRLESLKIKTMLQKTPLDAMFPSELRRYACLKKKRSKTLLSSSNQSNADLVEVARMAAWQDRLRALRNDSRIAGGACRKSLPNNGPVITQPPFSGASTNHCTFSFTLPWAGGTTRGGRRRASGRRSASGRTGEALTESW